MNFQNYTFSSAFPRAANYRHGKNSTVCESSPSYHSFPYRERHLQCLWADPRLRPVNLSTTDGEPIEVEHPGDWNLEAGPDFLNAILRIGRERRRVGGDLEIHIHPADWKQHGHTHDPRYRNVRFHVVFFPGLEIPGLLQIPLQKLLSTDPHFSFENIDTTAYPYSIPHGNFPLKPMHPDQKTEWLESAGEERLRLKTERLALAIQTKSPDQVLWEELLAALGYKNNKAPFRRLAALFPLARIPAAAETPDETYALLLGLSGLLPKNPDPDWSIKTRMFVRTLWDFWWKKNNDLSEFSFNWSDWSLSGIRPANHPVRRLMAAAYYAFRIQSIPQNAELLSSFPINFWTTHISWKRECSPTSLVGEARAHAMITNILVPFRAAIGETKLTLQNLPTEPSNSIIRQTAHTLFGPDHSPKVYRSALARQGLIQVFHDYLVSHRLNELTDLV
ncbi:MAG: DUF2851 family protein [Lentisphaerae bacterium]|jgi:hypothetical protein|nr:DUF2851 family protein [Lentisphaerota bacterium]